MIRMQRICHSFYPITELELGEQSMLITQGMGPGYGYDVVHDSWAMIANVFKKAIEE